jgi:hypothetical protein
MRIPNALPIARLLYRQTLRLSVLLCFSVLVSGCMGGSIARQIASSIAMQVADKAVGHMVDKPQVEEQGKTNQLLMSPGLDPYQAAFLRAELVTPPAMPQEPPSLPKPDPAESAAPFVTRLATVEVWGLVIGDEKRSMLENIRDLGITTLPPEDAWDQWQLAEGGIPGENSRPLLILVPPELGKVRSGDHAVIELGMANGFYVAKDRLE